MQVANSKAVEGAHCAICAPLRAISPLIYTPEGDLINPLFDAVKQFDIHADTWNAALGANGVDQLTLTAQAEENVLGDFVCSQLRATHDPSTARYTVSIKTNVGDKVFMNAPVLDRFLFGDGQGSRDLPCCFLIQAANFVSIRVQNLEAATTNVKISARGARILPYAYPGLQEELMAYWNTKRSTPFWLTIDRITAANNVSSLTGGGVRIGSGLTASVFMTIPSDGDFEAQELLSSVEGALYSQVEVRVFEGSSGRTTSTRALPLDHVSVPNLVVPGFVQGEDRAAQGDGRGLPWRHNFKRATRVRVDVTNNGPDTADVYLCWRGVMHYYGQCGPRGAELARATSLEPLLGPILSRSQCPPAHTFEADSRCAYPPYPSTVAQPAQAPQQLEGWRPGQVRAVPWNPYLRGVERADGGEVR